MADCVDVHEDVADETSLCVKDVTLESSEDVDEDNGKCGDALKLVDELRWWWPWPPTLDADVSDELDGMTPKLDEDEDDVVIVVDGEDDDDAVIGTETDKLP